MISVDEAWEECAERIGEPLRAVTRFQSTEFETRMRADVRAQYTDREDQRVVDQVVLDQLISRDLEEEFKCGKLTGTVHTFEDAWILVQTNPTNRRSGFLVSIDRGEDMTLSHLESCLEYIQTEAFSDSSPSAV